MTKIRPLVHFLIIIQKRIHFCHVNGKNENQIIKKKIKHYEF